MPTSVGRYEIVDKIGEGAMGVVYRARDRTIGRVVALKMLSADLDGEDELRKRFEREVRAAGALIHPNVVTVFDYGESEGHPFMAMELLEGEDLRAMIERQADLSLPDRLRILVEIARGLGFAHSKGIVHRDIKPANILVTSQGTVKILDFGLARVGTGGSITRRGVILGTPDYMSPEQATGKTVDQRSDIFSAGSVFYEFLTLEKPFKGKTLHSVLYQILSHDPTPMLTLNPDLPARLAALVHRMMRKRPERRPAAMDAVIDDLQTIESKLRRSGSRSTLLRRRGPLPVSPVSDQVAARVRGHVKDGRAHYEAGRFQEALTQMRQALKLEPACEEAAEILWRSQQKVRQEAAQGPALDERVRLLLARAAVEPPGEDAQQALTELAVIAPEHAEVTALLRKRNRQI